MVDRVLWKKEGWAGLMGAEGGNTPTLSSLPSKYAIDDIRSVSGGYVRQWLMQMTNTDLETVQYGNDESGSPCGHSRWCSTVRVPG